MDANKRKILIASLSGVSAAAAAASLAAQSLGLAFSDLSAHGETIHRRLQDGGRAFMDIETLIPYGDDPMPMYTPTFRTYDPAPGIPVYGRSGGQQKSRDVAKGRAAAKAARKARRVTRHAK